MKFKETLKQGMLLMPVRDLQLHKAHDPNVTIVIAANTRMMVWGFDEIPEEHDHVCGMEIEFLLNADIWAFPVPREDQWGNYFVPVTERENDSF